MTGRLKWLVYPGLVVSLAGAPQAGRAQAVCSAPHSSPTLGQGGSLGTLAPGTGWVQLSLYRQRSTEFFNHSGERQDFLADSEFDTRSVFVTGALGVIPGVEVWAQIPTHHLGVEGGGGSSTSTGVGDIRLAVRVGAEVLGSDLPLAIRLGAKLPGSDFPVDATVLPLSEGQRDWEASIETGHRFQTIPLYVMGWIGQRWRAENRVAARHPGDETFAHVAVGGAAGRLNWELATAGLWGRPPLAQGVRLEADRRRLVQILPTVGMDTGPGRLEFTAQIPVSGRVLPAGYGFSLGYRILWGL